MANATVPNQTPLRRRPRSSGGMQLAELFAPDEDHKIRLAAQIGITHGIVMANRVLSRVPSSQYVEALLKIRSDLQSAGLVFAGVESHPVPAEKIKLGLPGRDEEMENYKAAIDALGRVEIPVLCYNWMAGLGWYRTKYDAHERGGALTSEFDAEAAAAQG